MGDVFANGREVSGKATPNKVIAGFPSVCLSPPSPPAGPIPIPYPMFTEASKTSGGTGSVHIKKKEVGKKNGSSYSKSNGNEPATRSFGMDVASQTISGASKHDAYSFDVLFEKSGAERFMDLTTTNHSNPGTAAGFDAAKPSPGSQPSQSDCEKLDSNNKAHRGDDNVQDRNTGRKNADGDPIRFRESGTLCSGFAYGGSAGGMFEGMSLTSKLKKAYKSIFAPSVKKKKNQKAKGFTMKFCDGKCPNHPGGGAQAHAELNVLNRMATSPPNVPTSPGDATKVLLNIDWQPYGEDPDKVPCEKCEKTMDCACEQKCLDIYLCDDEGKPQSFCNRKSGSL